VAVVHSTGWEYLVYDDITEKLVASGIPRSQIAAVGDADPVTARIRRKMPDRTE
jgi:hypothetical protein